MDGRDLGKRPAAAVIAGAVALTIVLFAAVFLIAPDHISKESTTGMGPGNRGGKRTAGNDAPPKEPPAVKPPARPSASPYATGRLIIHGPRSNRLVAITFDACETPGKKYGFDRPIVDYLVRSKTAATFFLGGKWITSHPRETKLLARYPFFELGTHSQTHAHLTRLSGRALRHEIYHPVKILSELTGRNGLVWRAPFGEVDREVTAEAKKLGLATIQWEVVSGDPDPSVSAVDIVRGVLGRARPGSIIIFHVNGRGWNTAEALPQVVAGLKKKGLAAVTVSDLLGAKDKPQAGAPASPK